MVDLSTIPHHPAIENLTGLITNRVKNDDKPFFRTLVAYHLMTAAATMRVMVRPHNPNEEMVPVNGYVIALSPSGTGKGYSMGILEREIFGDFRKTFTHYTLPTLAENSLWKLAIQRAAQRSTDEQTEYDKLAKDYENTGEYLFSFDDGHPSAIKQVRDKLLMAGAGSINFIVDEIGLNLDKIAPALPLFLELFDQGTANQKLYMNTNDRKRVAQIEGKTPANMILFGAPQKLFDGGKTEDLFYAMLETGYARRCIFALGHPAPKEFTGSDEEIYDALCDPADRTLSQQWSDHIASLADAGKFGWIVDVPRDVGLELFRYEMECKAQAEALPDHDDIRRTELSHRYYKTQKLAGAFAFIEESMTMTMDHLLAAMKLVEESGESFQSILSRERPYMKLARYIASCNAEVTHADLLEALPFYESSQAKRAEMMTLATAWGYKQHIIIKKRYIDNVEFFSGEALEKTSLKSLILAHSDHFGYNYQADEAPFEELHQLLTMDDYNWTAHRFKNEHRTKENVIPGFNLLVLDFDGTVPLHTIHDLLEDYTFITQTTKRHTADVNRFRLIMPMNYKLCLDPTDYAQFMRNVQEWLPYQADKDALVDISRKWATYEHAQIYHNKGELLDVLPFIPRTSRNDSRTKELKELQSLDALERWFAHRFMEGDRNNQMIKFALALVDTGMSFPEVEAKVLAFNAKLADKLSDNELRKTVLVTVAKKLQNNP